jgi:tellurium resistance protein TerD
MAINLQKGQRVDVNLTKLGVGLGWDPNDADTGAPFDLDASAFMLGNNKKIPTDHYFVFYNNLQSPDGALTHTGDVLEGEAEGDDETIKVDLTTINPSITEVLFVVTIHEAKQRRQNFGQVRNSYIRIYNDITGEEIARYDLDEDFSVETAVEFGRLYKKDNKWRFEAVGVGYSEGLQEFVNKYA